jgi:hypothetical protein
MFFGICHFQGRSLPIRSNIRPSNAEPYQRMKSVDYRAARERVRNATPQIWPGDEEDDQIFVTDEMVGRPSIRRLERYNYMNYIYFKVIYERKYIRGIDENRRTLG